MQSMCISLAHITHALSDINWEVHDTDSLHNTLIKWGHFNCGNKSFCSLLALELLHMVIVAI